MKAESLAGKQLGRLLVLRPGPRTERGKEQWFCRCECGVEVLKLGALLRGGRTRSCGCLQAEMRRTGAPHRLHGLSGTRIHKQWRSMIERCENPRSKFWPDYGGRGIRVCAGWRADLPAFAHDVGEPPTPSHSLDRIDNARGYDCGNCADCVGRGAMANWRWATSKEQNRNRRSNRLVTYQGETLCLAEWSERLELDPDRVWNRLSLGWSAEEAFEIPITDSPWAARKELARRRAEALRKARAA